VERVMGRTGVSDALTSTAAPVIAPRKVLTAVDQPGKIEKGA